jgi:cytochrome c oxidase cbb3-type subunit 4
MIQMSTHSFYDNIRHIADSWGLVVMLVVFLVLAAWPFLPGGKQRSQDAAEAIFKDDDDGE